MPQIKPGHYTTKIKTKNTCELGGLAVTSDGKTPTQDELCQETNFKKLGKGTGEMAQWLLTTTCEGPGFSSQYPYDSLYPSVTPVPGDPAPSSDLHRHQTQETENHEPRSVQHTDTLRKYWTGQPWATENDHNCPQWAS